MSFVDVHWVAVGTSRTEWVPKLLPYKHILLQSLLVIWTEGSDSIASRPNIRGIPNIMVCRILMLMWSFGALWTLGASTSRALTGEDFRPQGPAGGRRGVALEGPRAQESGPAK